MPNPFEILVTYADYRQAFIAELWLNNIHTAELYEDAQGGKHVEVYCPPEHVLSLPLKEFQEALQQAKDRLWPPTTPQ